MDKIREQEFSATQYLSDCGTLPGYEKEGRLKTSLFNMLAEQIDLRLWKLRYELAY